jgi:hypothetical protein
MPVEFLSDEQVGAYGRFTGELSAAEVERFFYLDDADRNQALAGVRAGDALVVPKLDRLARSVPDARAIGDDLADRGIKLSLGGQVYDPADPMGKMFFNILATFAEFEVDLLRMRAREGMAVARAKADSEAASLSSRPGSRPNCGVCTPPATTSLPIWPNCSPCPGPPCTGLSSAAPPGFPGFRN